MATPTKLSQLRYQETAEVTGTYSDVEKYANHYFSDMEGPVKINYLFMEDGIRVWECYTDPGSDLYLYIKQTIKL